MDFKMPSAICFNMDQPKILSSCNELNSKIEIGHSIILHSQSFSKLYDKTCAA